MTIGLLTQRCISFGVPFELAADSDGVLAKMLERAPLGTQCGVAHTGEAQQFAVLRLGGSTGYRLVLNDEVAAESAELKPVLDQFARYLMVHVANHAPDRVFVHGGVVGWRGHALVLPEPALPARRLSWLNWCALVRPTIPMSTLCLMSRAGCILIREICKCGRLVVRCKDLWLSNI